MNFNNILQWWIGYKLPLVHVKLNYGFKKFVADLIYHPIKRRIAKYYIILLKKLTNIKIIAITGSAGKTTTKEMIASILSNKGKTIYSVGNLDPVFNIPLTLLKCSLKTKYLVLEFGVEYPNEMDFYLWLVKPDMGVITNIFPTHTLYFKNKVGVLTEKRKLVQYTKTVVLNQSDKLLKSIKLSKEQRVYWFTKGSNLIETNKNTARIVAKNIGINSKLVEDGLADYNPQKHRLNIIKHKSGAVIVDDSYNSNPEALIESIKYFNKVAGKRKKILVVGDMLELGELSVGEHKRLGKYVSKYKFERVYGVGEQVKYITKNVKTIDGVYADIKKYLKPNVCILVKGSRSIGLDRLVDMLL